VELEDLKIKTRLTNEKFASVKGECEILFLNNESLVCPPLPPYQNFFSLPTCSAFTKKTKGVCVFSFFEFARKKKALSSAILTHAVIFHTSLVETHRRAIRGKISTKKKATAAIFLSFVLRKLHSSIQAKDMAPL
jgi:hypothetical protein